MAKNEGPKTDLAGPPGSLETCLVVLTGRQLGRRVDLDGPATLGADDTCEVQLADAAPGGDLAKVANEGGCWTLRSLAPETPIFLNDEPITATATIGHGDRLRVGDVELKVLISDELDNDYHDEIYRLVTHDNLTDAFNKRYLLESLEPLISRARRWQVELSLVVVRLEGLEAYRERQGAAAAAQSLRRLARVLIDLSRTDDVVARVADDEFALLLYRTPGEGADVVSRRIGEIPAGGELRLALGKTTLDATQSTAQAMLEAAQAAVK